MNKVIFSLSLLAFSSGAFAEMSFEQELRTQCNRVKSNALLGKQLYDQKNYQKALIPFQQQAAWSSFCEINREESGVSFSEQAISTAFNNVGLTYAKLGQYGWARAWFSVFPEIKSTQFNVRQLPNPTQSASWAGTYVQHAGFGQWNTITVKRIKNAYDIEFNGLYMGTRSLIYGPNMGEFRTQMPLKNTQAAYRVEDCKVDLKFGFDAKQGSFVQVKETNIMSCGFGHNVSAQGMYLKVE
ncbi:hypothetical protein G9F31_04790 [Acinetobacter sp. 187]|uniref:hypothetical protein n=1 Tax=Acinetobacter lanii TaxID=2715163 RepID=UPI00140DB283|nr:hypothetical protein [Acinetobacter lanii]NHC03085.1 hypothetical protein [Acinetobacter lanii]